MKYSDVKDFDDAFRVGGVAALFRPRRRVPAVRPAPLGPRAPAAVLRLPLVAGLLTPHPLRPLAAISCSLFIRSL